MFTADEKTLDKIADYCDKKQFGDVFLDDESDDLILTLEEGWSHGGKERVMNFVSQFHKRFPAAQIYMIGTINDEEADRVKSYECQSKGDYVRYRETEWLYDSLFDEDMSCEEFEEENYVDVDEDEYEEYVHRAKEGIRADDGEMYGDWEYLDE
jgi:hypothetical protein